MVRVRLCLREPLPGTAFGGVADLTRRIVAVGKTHRRGASVVLQIVGLIRPGASDYAGRPGRRSIL